MRYLSDSCCIMVNHFTHDSNFMSGHLQSASNVRLVIRFKVGSSCLISQPAMLRVSSEVSESRTNPRQCVNVFDVS